MLEQEAGSARTMLSEQRRRQEHVVHEEPAARHEAMARAARTAADEAWAEAEERHEAALQIAKQEANSENAMLVQKLGDALSRSAHMPNMPCQGCIFRDSQIHELKQRLDERENY